MTMTFLATKQYTEAYNVQNSNFGSIATTLATRCKWLNFSFYLRYYFDIICFHENLFKVVYRSCSLVAWVTFPQQLQVQRGQKARN